MREEDPLLHMVSRSCGHHSIVLPLVVGGFHASIVHFVPGWVYAYARYPTGHQHAYHLLHFAAPVLGDTPAALMTGIMNYQLSDVTTGVYYPSDSKSAEMFSPLLEDLCQPNEDDHRVGRDVHRVLPFVSDWAAWVVSHWSSYPRCLRPHCRHRPGSSQSNLSKSKPHPP